MFLQAGIIFVVIILVLLVANIALVVFLFEMKTELVIIKEAKFAELELDCLFYFAVRMIEH